jgi:hypothetical protein
LVEDSRRENGADEAERMVKIVLDDDESLLNFCVMTSHKILSCPTVSTRMQFLSPFHLNLVVVGAALLVIDFDDGRVIV